MHASALVGLVLQAGVAFAAAAQSLPGSDGPWPAGGTRVALRVLPVLEPAAQAPGFALPPRGSAADPGRGVTGNGVFGDYVFARPALGSLRATSGVLLAQAGGLPLGAPAGAEVDAGQAYLGLGIDGAPLRPGLRLNADLGVAALRPPTGAATYGARSAAGLAPRDLRLAPRVQVGLRYAF